MVSRGRRLRRGPSPCPGHQLAPARFPEPKGRSPRRPPPQSHALAGPAPGRDASHSLAAPPPSGLPWAGAGGGPRLFLAPRLWPSPPKVDPGMLQGAREHEAGDREPRPSTTGPLGAQGGGGTFSPPARPAHGARSTGRHRPLGTCSDSSGGRCTRLFGSQAWSGLPGRAQVPPLQLSGSVP